MRFTSGSRTFRFGRFIAFASCLTALVVAIGCSGDRPPGGADNELNVGENNEDNQPEPVENACDSDEMLCDGGCIDPDVDPRHCGECGEECPEGHLCRDGECRAHDGDCPANPCEGFTYCDGTTGVCRPGCVDDEDCGGGRICNEETRTCECPDQQRNCGGACFGFDDPEACGEQCLQCPEGDKAGSWQCVEGQCEVTCEDGLRQCGGECVLCPAYTDETACEEGECIATSCLGDYRACGGQCAECPNNASETECDGSRCVASRCPGTERACGGECVECPLDAAETTCDGGECVASECGFDHISCDGECVDCPANVQEGVCEGGECVAAECGSGDRACGGEYVDCPDVESTTCQNGACVEDCSGDGVELCSGDTTCTNTSFDSSNCGECGNVCNADKTCVNGECQEPSVHVYTASDDETVRKLDSGGTEVWSFDGHTDAVNGVAVDPDGYVYTASKDTTVRKIAPDGDEVWQYDIPDKPVLSVAVGPEGRVYAGAAESVHQFDETGQQNWSVDEPYDFAALSVDSDSDLYGFAGPRIWNWNSGSDEVWSQDVDGDGGGIATHSPGYVYTVTPYRVDYRDADDGSTSWSSSPDVDSLARDVAVDIDGAAHVIWENGMLQKFGVANGDLLWDVVLGPDDQTARAVAVDSAGDVYVARGPELYKLNSEPAQLWVEQPHAGAINDVAVDPGAYGAFPDSWED